MSTIGVDFKAVQTMVKGGVCTLQLWDTAGQERFSGVTGNYYRNADGFILVFDMTRRASFLHIDYWLKQARRTKTQTKDEDEHKNRDRFSPKQTKEN